MKKTFLFLLLLMSGCTSVGSLEYGFLPDISYQFYPPQTKIDLKQRRLHYEVIDKRNAFWRTNCSEVELRRDSELEGEIGLQYFRNYLNVMTEKCGGQIDSLPADTVHVELQVLCSRLIGFGFITAHGLVQFKVTSSQFSKTYCSDMQDGDDDAPYGKFAFVTRATAMRGIVSGSCRRAFENFLSDLVSVKTADNLTK